MYRKKPFDDLELLKDEISRKLGYLSNKSAGQIREIIGPWVDGKQELPLSSRLFSTILQGADEEYYGFLE